MKVKEAELQITMDDRKDDIPYCTVVQVIVSMLLY